MSTDIWIDYLTDAVGKIQFTEKQCIESFDVLTNVFGKWLEKAIHEKPTKIHPLARKWTSRGLPIIMELTLLGQDLKILQNASNFDELVNNLENPAKYQASVYETHIGALFKRNPLNSNFEFYPPTDKGFADVRFQLHDKWVYVECTSLRRSNAEMEFSRLFTKARQKIFSELIRQQKWCEVKLELRKKLSDIAVLSLINTVKKCLNRWKRGRRIKYRDSLAIISISPVRVIALNMRYAGPRWVFMQAPADEVENSRIRKIFKGKVRQLTKGHINIITIGMSSYQNPWQIFPPIAKRELDQSQNTRVSGVFLTRQIQHPLDKLYNFDELYLLKNRFAANPIPKSGIPYQTVGPLAKMTKIQPKSPVYSNEVGELDRIQPIDPSKYGKVLIRGFRFGIHEWWSAGLVWDPINQKPRPIISVDKLGATIG